MPAPARVVTVTVTRLLICLVAIPSAAFSQTQTPTRDQTEVIRVFTQLIQTDVMVFDKDGKFKDNLRREDFELRIDGKVKPIEFFERVAAGSANEEAQLAAARGSAPLRGPKINPFLSIAAARSFSTLTTCIWISREHEQQKELSLASSTRK